MPNVVMVVPGIMGSVLRQGGPEGEIIWPGTLWSYMFSYSDMEALLSPDLVATELIECCWKDVYNVLLDALQKCEFQPDGDTPTLQTFPYDWRQDLRKTAADLADAIDETVDMHGDGVEVTLLCHSMGGLIGRYYIESGQFDGRRGHESIRQLIMMGTPNNGAPKALFAALGQESMIFLNAAQVKRVASDERYPSIYQLFPPSDMSFAWDGSANGELRAVDLYDAVRARQLGLCAENLKAASDFRGKLDASRRPNGVRYFCFIGTRQSTSTAVNVIQRDERVTVRDMKDPDGGDETVPIWSASLHKVQGCYVGGGHTSMFKDRKLRRVLATLLGHQGVLDDDGPSVSVLVSPEIVKPGESVILTLKTKTRLDRFYGEISLQRGTVDRASGSISGYGAAEGKLPIRYEGASIRELRIEFSAPDAQGLYLVNFLPENDALDVEASKLIVQLQ